MKNCFFDLFEVSREGGGLLAMEGLRGVAVFLVFIVHYSALVYPWLSPDIKVIADQLKHIGHLGVDLFFVLSGYLIYGSIIKNRNFVPLDYAKRRIVRLYPAFFFVLSLYIFLSAIFPSESKIPSELLEAVFYLLMNIFLIPGFFPVEPIITVAWSLSYEAFYYFFAPVVIFSLNMKKWSPIYRIIFWAALCLFSGYFLFESGGPIRLIMFVPGIILYEIFNELGVRVRHGGALSFFIGIFFFIIYEALGLDFFDALLIVSVCFFWVCIVAFSGGNGFSRFLCIAPLRWLGNMSYSYYLIHGLTLKFSFLVIDYFLKPVGQWSGEYFVLWLPLFVFTLIVSAILYIFIERPFSVTKMGWRYMANLLPPAKSYKV